MDTYRFSLIDPERDRQASFTLMRELRPHLADASAFTAQIARQAGQGYRLLGAWQSEQLMGLAGYRLQENLLYGQFLYVDDLVVAAATRSQGLGAKLIDWLREEAERQHCAHLVLDTALGNALGQRFYFQQGLLSKGLHFCQPLPAS